MICPKCNCEIRIETDACPFCGFIFPRGVNGENNETLIENNICHSVPQKVKDETEHKNVKFKKRNLLNKLISDDLPSEVRAQLNQEIIILFLFVLIILGIVQIIILSGLK